MVHFAACRGGLLSGRALTTEPDGTISSAPGSRFQPSSGLSGMLQGSYRVLLPIFQQLKEVLVRPFILKLSPVIHLSSYIMRAGAKRNQHVSCRPAVAAAP